MQTIREMWIVKVFHKSHKIVLCRIVDSRTTDRLSLRQVEGVVEKKMYQFLARGIVNWVLQYYLNSDRICHRIFPFQKVENHTWYILETGRTSEFLVYVAP
jgi:hypothetical protein